MKTIQKLLDASVVAAVIAVLATGCVSTSSTKRHELEQRRITENLKNFDDLDYNVFTKQKWSEFHRSHAYDIKVYWPDGRTTLGLEKHIEDLKAMFVWAPDTRITEHPVKIGQGEWTAVMGIMKGTFTKPMPIGDGKTIAPTGKPYEIRMVTVSHWNDQGLMDKEYLFWDNQEFMKQIGIGK